MTPSSIGPRIGAVEYLNTEPLIYRLRALLPACDLRLDVPRRLAEQLHAGYLDVALVPTASYFHHPEWTVVSDACIACRGPVWSVKLLSRVPIESVETLATDNGSATSVVLARVLLDQHGVRAPQVEAFPLDQPLAETRTDAVVVIGDRAMRPPPAEFRYAWDLGETWWQRTGLPFVFAVWAGKVGDAFDDVERALEQARDQGNVQIPAIAAAAAKRRGLASSEIERYLATNLHFHLGVRERQSMMLFYQEAQRLELVPPGQEPRIQHDCQVAG